MSFFESKAKSLRDQSLIKNRTSTSSVGSVNRPIIDAAISFPLNRDLIDYL